MPFDTRLRPSTASRVRWAGLAGREHGDAAQCGALVRLPARADVRPSHVGHGAGRPAGGPARDRVRPAGPRRQPVAAPATASGRWSTRSTTPCSRPRSRTRSSSGTRSAAVIASMYAIKYEAAASSTSTRRPDRGVRAADAVARAAAAGDGFAETWAMFRESMHIERVPAQRPGAPAGRRPRARSGWCSATGRICSSSASTSSSTWSRSSCSWRARAALPYLALYGNPIDAEERILAQRASAAGRARRLAGRAPLPAPGPAGRLRRAAQRIRGGPPGTRARRSGVVTSMRFRAGRLRGL